MQRENIDARRRQEKKSCCFFSNLKKNDSFGQATGRKRAWECLFFFSSFFSLVDERWASFESRKTTGKTGKMRKSLKKTKKNDHVQ